MSPLPQIVPRGSPAASPAGLLRPRLLERIAHPHVAPVTLIIAPVGYGKSTLARQWTSEARHPVAWVSLGPECNHPERFLARLLAALPGPTGEGVASAEEVLARLGARTAASQPLTIVLDDLHLIECEDVFQALDALLQARLPTVRWLILSRTPPLLTLARLRLEGHVREIGMDDLSFTRQEVEEVVARSATIPLSDDQMQELMERTAGWIAGILLAISALGLEGHRDQPEAARWAATSWIDDYIMEEVLAALPDDLRAFVLRSSVLPYLDPALCDDVLQITTSAGLIEQVRERLVFVRPGGPDGRMLTYHALFAESVARIAARSSPRGELLDLHRRAALRFRRQGHLALAAEQAIRGEAWDLAVEIVRAICRPLIDSDHRHSVWYWLRKMPRELLLNDPELARWYISTLHHLGHHQAAEEAYAAARPIWQKSGSPAHQAYDLLCQTLSLAMNGHPEGAVQKAYEAVAIAPDDLAIDLMHAWTYIYQIEAFRGDDDRADHAYREAKRHRTLLPADQWHWFSNTELHRINTEAVRGRLHSAEQMYTHKLEHRPQTLVHVDGKLRYRRSSIWLEWNQLARVEVELDDLRHQALALPDRIWHQDVLMHVGRAQGALGNLDGMESTLRQVREMVRERGGRHDLNRLEALEVDLWLATERLALAQDWTRRKSHEVYAPPLLFGDPDPRLARVKIAIASDEPDRALQALAPMIEDATTRRGGAEIVVLTTWQMIGRLHTGNEPCALESLALALRYGRPAGFMRSFMGQAPGMFTFLRKALAALPEADAAYLRSLIDGGIWAAPEAGRGDGPAVALLPDPISRREQDVLWLLPRGLTNREIGERLFISELTVKKHVGSILGKLGVTNRRSAVVRARHLGLLGDTSG